MKKFFIRFLIQHFTFFIVLVGILMPAYLCLYNRFIENSINDHFNYLKNGLDIIAIETNRIYSSVNTIYKDERFIRLSYINKPLQPNHYYWIECALNQLNNYMKHYTNMASTKILYDYGIIYKNGLCITSKRAFFDIESFYNKFLSFSDISASEWISILQNNSSHKLYIGSSNYYDYDRGSFEGITMVRRLSYNHKANDNDVIYFIFDTDTVLSYLAPNNVLHSGMVLLQDKNGNVLASKGTLKNDKKYKKIQYSNPTTRFLATVYIPNEILSLKMEPINKIIALSIISCTILGFLLAFLFAWRNSKPLRELLVVLKEQEPAGTNQYTASDYKYILHSIEKLNTDLRKAKNIILEQQQMIEVGIIEKAIHGLIYTQDELKQVEKILNPDHNQILYGICMIKLIGSTTNASLSLFTIIKVLREKLYIKLKSHFTGNDSLIIFLPVGKDGYNDINSYREILTKICKELRTKYKIPALFVVSDLFNSIELLPEAFSQVKHMLRLLVDNTEQYVIFKSDIPCPNLPIPAGEEYVKNYYDLLMAGDINNIRLLIQNTLKTVKNLGYVSKDYIHQVFLSFIHVLETVKYKQALIHLNDIEIPQYSDNDSLAFMFSKIMDCSEKICERIVKNNVQKEAMYTASILDFINNNYTNFDLSINHIEEKFNIPARKIQELMHKSVGRSFSDYIEELRMKKAYDLITYTNMPIVEISKSCGYMLSNTFYKAFRRKYNMAPSELRDKIRC